MPHSPDDSSDETRATAAATALDARTRRWCQHVLEQLGAGKILSTELLRGGLDALTMELETDGGQSFVIRCPFERPGSDAASRSEHEAEVLTVLRKCRGLPPIPELVAVDPHGNHAGRPSLLTTRLAGRPDIAARSAQHDAAGRSDAFGRHGVNDRVRQLARVLASIHQATIPDGTSLPPASGETDSNAPSKVDAGSPLDAAIWQAVFVALEDRRLRLKTHATCLTHGDFHLGNALFAEGQLTGIVDWGEAGLGCCEAEVGYCRADLALLMGGDSPDVFLDEYQRASGECVQDLELWDLAGAARAYPDPAPWAVAWRTLGRDDLNDGRVRRRLDRFVRGALQRLHR